MSDSPGAECAVVVVAAGSGERLGRGIAKARVHLAGEPILCHCLRRVQAANLTPNICAVIPDGDDQLAGVCADFGAKAVPGGATRAQSVRNALAALPDVRYVLIHDAARPLAPVPVFHRVLDGLRAGAAAVIPAVPVVDTIKLAEPCRDGIADGVAEQVHSTVDREKLRAVQTPQGFDLVALRRAHTGRAAEELTDDAMAMEAAGYRVTIVPGSAHSLKITTETDLLFAAALLQATVDEHRLDGAQSSQERP